MQLGMDNVHVLGVELVIGIARPWKKVVTAARREPIVADANLGGSFVKEASLQTGSRTVR